MSYFRKRLTCLFKGHVIAEDSAVEEMGAVYHGGICERCLRPVMREFIVNYWDDAKTKTEDGQLILRGINPVLREGRYVVRSWETVQDVSAEMLHQKRS